MILLFRSGLRLEVVLINIKFWILKTIFLSLICYRIKKR